MTNSVTAKIIPQKKGAAPGFKIGTPIYLCNADNTNVRQWYWEIVNTPSASKVSAKALSAVLEFTPDEPGVYTVLLKARSGDVEAVDHHQLIVHGRVGADFPPELDGLIKFAEQFKMSATPGPDGMVTFTCPPDVVPPSAVNFDQTEGWQMFRMSTDGREISIRPYTRPPTVADVIPFDEQVWFCRHSAQPINEVLKWSPERFKRHMDVVMKQIEAEHGAVVSDAGTPIRFPEGSPVAEAGKARADAKTTREAKRAFAEHIIVTDGIRGAKARTEETPEAKGHTSEPDAKLLMDQLLFSRHANISFDEVQAIPPDQFARYHKALVDSLAHEYALVGRSIVRGEESEALRQRMDKSAREQWDRIILSLSLSPLSRYLPLRHSTAEFVEAALSRWSRWRSWAGDRLGHLTREELDRMNDEALMHAVADKIHKLRASELDDNGTARASRAIATVSAFIQRYTGMGTAESSRLSPAELLDLADTVLKQDRQQAHEEMTGRIEALMKERDELKAMLQQDSEVKRRAEQWQEIATLVHTYGHDKGDAATLPEYVRRVIEKLQHWLVFATHQGRRTGAKIPLSTEQAVEHFELFINVALASAEEHRQVRDLVLDRQIRMSANAGAAVGLLDAIRGLIADAHVPSVDARDMAELRARAEAAIPTRQIVHADPIGRTVSVIGSASLTNDELDALTRDAMEAQQMRAVLCALRGDGTMALHNLRTRAEKAEKERDDLNGSQNTLAVWLKLDPANIERRYRMAEIRKAIEAIKERAEAADATARPPAIITGKGLQIITVSSLEEVRSPDRSINVVTPLMLWTYRDNQRIDLEVIDATPVASRYPNGPYALTLRGPLTHLSVGSRLYGDLIHSET